MPFEEDLLRELGRGAEAREEAQGLGSQTPRPRSVQARLDRPVALKILRSQKNKGSTDQDRLVREAQALAKLAHPNVVTVYEVGEWQGHVYIAMELIQGTSLKSWRKIKPRGWREVVEVLLQAGRGLAAAHRAGIIHRDFKPANILVGDDGRVRARLWPRLRPDQRRGQHRERA